MGGTGGDGTERLGRWRSYHSVLSPPLPTLSYSAFPINSTQAGLKGLHGLSGNSSRGPTSLGTWMLREGL